MIKKEKQNSLGIEGNFLKMMKSISENYSATSHMVAHGGTWWHMVTHGVRPCPVHQHPECCFKSWLPHFCSTSLLMDLGKAVQDGLSNECPLSTWKTQMECQIPSFGPGWAPVILQCWKIPLSNSAFQIKTKQKPTKPQTHTHTSANNLFFETNRKMRIPTSAFQYHTRGSS